jgi:chromosomal replication initiation ATPase DnaA
MVVKDVNMRLEEVRAKVLQVTNIDVKNQTSRKRAYINAKKIFCKVARTKRATFHEIGNFIGYDHSTVVWHVRDFDFIRKVDEDFDRDYSRVVGIPFEGKLSRDLFDLSIGLV